MTETGFKIIRAKLHYLSRVERLLIKTVLLCFNKLIIVKNENNLLLAADPVIYAFNHNNYLETILVSFYLIFCRQGKKVSFVIDWMYGKLPLLGWLFNKIQPIYVYNKNARLAAINRQKKVLPAKKVYQECVARLKQQQSIGIFPEGARNKHPGVLKRGRKGVGAMVLASGAVVLPIGISFPVSHRCGWLAPLRAMHLQIGAPLDFAAELNLARDLAGAQALPAGKKKRLSMLLAAHITYRVMEALAQLSGKEYPYPAPKALPEVEALQRLKVPEDLCHGLKPARC